MPFRIQTQDEIIRVELSGAVTKADFQQLIDAMLAAERGGPKVLPRIIDLSGMEDSEYKFPDLMELAERRNATPVANAIKSAIVAPKPFQFGLARTYQTLMANPQVTVRVFRDYPAALGWIREG